MEAQIFCFAIQMAAQDFAPLSADRSQLACEMTPKLMQEASRIDVEPSLLFSLVWVESRWTSKDRSHKGACGLTQVLPKYVRESCRDLRNPYTSLRVGADALKSWMTKRVKRNKEIVRIPRQGGLEMALACYNAGHACNRSRRARFYAQKIMRITNQMNTLLAQIQEEHRRDIPIDENEYQEVGYDGYSTYLSKGSDRILD